MYYTYPNDHRHISPSQTPHRIVITIPPANLLHRYPCLSISATTANEVPSRRCTLLIDTFSPVPEKANLVIRDTRPSTISSARAANIQNTARHSTQQQSQNHVRLTSTSQPPRRTSLDNGPLATAASWHTAKPQIVALCIALPQSSLSTHVAGARRASSQSLPTSPPPAEPACRSFGSPESKYPGNPCSPVPPQGHYAVGSNVVVCRIPDVGVEESPRGRNDPPNSSHTHDSAATVNAAPPCGEVPMKTPEGGGEWGNWSEVRRRRGLEDGDSRCKTLLSNPRKTPPTHNTAYSYCTHQPAHTLPTPPHFPHRTSARPKPNPQGTQTHLPIPIPSHTIPQSLTTSPYFPTPRHYPPPAQLSVRLPACLQDKDTRPRPTQATASPSPTRHLCMRAMQAPRFRLPMLARLSPRSGSHGPTALPTCGGRGAKASARCRMLLAGRSTVPGALQCTSYVLDRRPRRSATLLRGWPRTGQLMITLQPAWCGARIAVHTPDDSCRDLARGCAAGVAGAVDEQTVRGAIGWVWCCGEEVGMCHGARRIAGLAPGGPQYLLRLGEYGEAVVRLSGYVGL
ncbi:hypothetical protein IQ07DRAFT_604015 [Pyrenochaeta sp. DS3sAY3a]|nr:hypothetical protein IQ07DRAFT_604015 [Pyrenochaeta sp. DS3sAY3a]